MEVIVDYNTFTAFVTANTVNIFSVEDSNGNYNILAQVPNANFSIVCILQAGDPNISNYTSNFSSTANQLPNSLVTTQFEYNNKDLKLASFSAEVDPSTGAADAYMLVPGVFGSGDGRYVLGGYGITEDYNKDDIATCYVTDMDRNIAWALALAENPNATSPIADAYIQAMGVLPAPFSQAFPDYPVVKNYYDTEVPETNQGWYFWPIAQGDGLPPVGEVEIESIAGYAFLPSGLYLYVVYQRPAGITTGGIRLNLHWGTLSTSVV